MAPNYATCLILVILVPIVCSSANSEDAREQKLISTFQVVRFPNDACIGSTTRNGTCYTSQECSNNGGTSSGSCADGFGVCCVFSISTCGMSSSENLTYWTQPSTVVAGSCSLTISPTTDDICSLRLDFTNFVITGPSTLSIVQVRRRFGQPNLNEPDNVYHVQGSTYTTNCLLDTFHSTSASPSSNAPVLCGTLTGEHVYVEADIDRGNTFNFNFADAASSAASTTRGVTSLATRTWDITVSQIECAAATLPPTGCTKYYWGSGLATLTNYNKRATDSAAGAHLGMQHERICIRREKGKCIGCFNAAATDFDLSFAGIAAETFTVVGGCCGYASMPGIVASETAANIANDGDSDGTNSQFGWDCIIIPGAFVAVSDTISTVITGAIQSTTTIQQVFSGKPTGAIYNQGSGPQMCGSGLGLAPGVTALSIMPLVTANGATVASGAGPHTTICTRNVPFQLEFMSDDLEGLGAEGTTSEFQDANQQYNQGFKISHWQLDC